MSELKENSGRTLSIRIDTDGFCFCSYKATEPDSMQYYYHEADNSKSLTANFDEAWNSCVFTVREQYSDLRVIVATPDFTTLPSAYDKKESNEILFRSCFPNVSQSSELLSNRLTAQDITVLFTLDKTLYTRLREISNITFYTPVSILLGYITNYISQQNRHMLAYIHKDKSLLIVMENGKPIICNRFKSESRHDQAFYLLSIWKDCKLSQTEDTLYLCGDNSVEELTPLLKQFIKQTQRINSAAQFRTTLLNTIKDIPFDLQALLLCE